MAGYALMRGLRALLPAGRGGYIAAAAVASWASVVLASSACALELALSGTSPLAVALPAMAVAHAVIGIGEALIAAAVLAAVVAARPDIVPEWADLDRKSPGAARLRRGAWSLAAAGAAVAVLLAVFGSPLASGAPDAMEKLAPAQDAAAAEQKDRPLWSGAFFTDYKVRGVASEKVSTSLAGLIGTVLVFGLGFAVIRALGSGSARGDAGD